MTENKEKKQFFSREQIKNFIDLLKYQKAECRDFTDETLSVMVQDEDFRLEDFAVRVRMELTRRCLIPADFTAFSAEEQLELLLNDIWYGLDDVTLAGQLKWDEFSPDAILALIKYHPGLFRHCPAWRNVREADPLLWSALIQRHAGYVLYCPAAVFKQLPPEELFKIALRTPGIAHKLPLNKLPQKMIDVLLREHPSLASEFDFTDDIFEEAPAGRLMLICNQELFFLPELDAVNAFLGKLLADFSREEGESILNSSCGHLGIFTCSRGNLLKDQIEQFLAEQGIAPEVLQVQFQPVNFPIFSPRGNIEAAIMEHHIGRIVQYSLEEEKLQRIDILTIENYFSLRRDIRCLVLMKALPENKRSNALFAMKLDKVPPAILEQAKTAFSFGQNPPERSTHENMLMEAALNGELTSIRDLAETVRFSFLTKQEALKIAGSLPEKAVQYLFNRSIPPMLRAYLITELTNGDATSQEVDLVNVLLQPYWHSEDGFAADNFGSFSDFDEDFDDDFEDDSDEEE